MQEDIEQRTMSVTVQAAKLSGRVLKAAIAAALQRWSIAAIPRKLAATA